MTNKFLNQEEIDLLLNTPDEDEPKTLSTEELDALGEIANISMGSGATALSELINHRVIITNPRITLMSLKDLLAELPEPHVSIEVEFIEGLIGSNMLIISNRDVAVLANLMMGEQPTVQIEPLNEIQVSAASEAMNQMIASAATAMSQVFNTSVNISPPELKYFEQSINDVNLEFVVIKFDMIVEGVINSKLIQMLPIESAKEQAGRLFEVTEVYKSQEEQEQEEQQEQEEYIQPKPADGDTDNNSLGLEECQDNDNLSNTNIELILDIPIIVSVVLGRTRKPIEEILNLQSGSIIELDTLVDENVDIYVNGTLVAKGEVVVVNDSFGVRITNIINPRERINQLRNELI